MTRKTIVRLVIFLTFIIGGAFGYSDFLIRQQLVNNEQFRLHLNELNKNQSLLLEELLKGTYLLVHNYDTTNKAFQNIDEHFTKLRMLEGEQGNEEISVQFALLDQYINKQQELFKKFETLNSIIKNSSQAIPGMLGRYMKTHFNEDWLEHRNYLRLILQVSGSVTLAKINQDPDYIYNLSELITKLEQFGFSDEKSKKFNRVFISHARVINRSLAEYVRAIDDIHDLPLRENLLKILEIHLLENERIQGQFQLINLSLAVAFIASMMFIMFLLLKVQRENIELIELQQALEDAAKLDKLTGLKNRFGLLQEDLEDKSLMLINIDQFKHVNDFYGSPAGDFVLKELSGFILANLPDTRHYRLYRMGGDEFAIVVDGDLSLACHSLGEKLLHLIEACRFNFEDADIQVSASIGVAHEQPLLEKADIALKSVKKSRNHYMEYQGDLQFEQKIAVNLSTLKMIKQALIQGRVVPFFQPLLNNQSGKIEKYECLIRIIEKDESVLNPGHFLDVAKESRLTGQLTRVMVEKSMEVFRHNKCRFSVNFAAEDLLDREVMEFVIHALSVNPEIASRMTIEVLETEAIEDYEIIRGVLRELKSYGCSISIDDFGAGYSNLKQVFRLDIDQLKIDASLIRDIDKSEDAKAIVIAIVEFAKIAQIPSLVAEFVHSADVQKVVEELGIEYSQGYHIGKPMPDLLEIGCKADS